MSSLRMYIKPLSYPLNPWEIADVYEFEYICKRSYSIFGLHKLNGLKEEITNADKRNKQTLLVTQILFF